MKVGRKMVKLDRRREYFLILDCETACLPHVADLAPEQRKTVGISKPLIYDIGWTIIDRQGRTYDRKNFLISEIFSVPSIFDTMPISARFTSKSSRPGKSFSPTGARLQKNLRTH